MAVKYPHVIAFRVGPQESRQLAALRATFPEQEWGEAIRWLLNHPDTQEIIAERLRQERQNRIRVTAHSGIEAGLPPSDR